MTEAAERAMECRKAVRAYYAQRAAVSLSAAAVQRGLSRDGGYSQAEVDSAHVFLVSRGHLQTREDPDGAKLYHQITAEGLIAYERG